MIRSLSLILVVCLLATAGCSSSGSSPGGAGAATVALTEDQIKAQAIDVGYDDLLRYPENYQGKTVHIMGGVTQVREEGRDKYLLRVLTKPSSVSPNWYIEDDVLVNWNGADRYLEKDILEIYGSYTGPKTYTTVLGAERTAPEINAQLIYLYEEKNEYVMQTLAPLVTAAPKAPAAAAAPANTVEYISVTLNGNGNDVQSLTFPSDGFYIVKTTMHADGYNSVIMKSAGGDYEALLANDVGAFDSKKSTKISAGKHFFEVTSSGSWSIEISKA